MADILIRGKDLLLPERSGEILEVFVFSDGTIQYGKHYGYAIELPEHGDLIDRDAFNADARKRYCSACDNYNGAKCRACWVDDMLGEVEDAPTVSPNEVRGVVRCKDCKWCHAGYCEKHDDLIPWGCANKPWEDWFCADGKRREIIKEEQDAD